MGVGVPLLPGKATVVAGVGLTTGVASIATIVVLEAAVVVTLVLVVTAVVVLLATGVGVVALSPQLARSKVISTSSAVNLLFKYHFAIRINALFTNPFS
jgi:hypothetical protein